MMQQRVLQGTAFFVLMLFAVYSQGHNLAPALLNLDLVDDNIADVRWRTTNKQMAGIDLMPIFPESCRDISEQAITLKGRAVVYQWQVACEPGMVGQTIRFRDLERSGLNVMAVYTDQNGRQESRLLHSKNPHFVVPETLSLLDTMQQYLLSGIEHLVFGWDHVLFVLGLLFLLHRQLRVLILAATSFTIGHSFSLILASLGFLPFNVQLIEIFIAATLIVMALEILSIHRPARAFSIRRQPYVVTLLFGLIHGCGFAAVLADALSREGNIIAPLLSFNIGIEVGQLLIIVFVLGLIALFSRAGFSMRTEKLSGFAGYPVGIMATYWLIERLLA